MGRGADESQGQGTGGEEGWESVAVCEISKTMLIK